MKALARDLKVVSAVVMMAAAAVYFWTCFRLAERAEEL
jgi:hypothetical protein